MRLIRESFDDNANIPICDLKGRERLAFCGEVEVQPIVARDRLDPGEKLTMLRIGLGEKRSNNGLGSRFWLELRQEEALELVEKLVGLIRSEIHNESIARSNN